MSAPTTALEMVDPAKPSQDFLGLTVGAHRVCLHPHGAKPQGPRKRALRRYQQAREGGVGIAKHACSGY